MKGSSSPSTSKVPSGIVIPDVQGMTQKEAARAYLEAGIMPHPWHKNKASARRGFRFSDASVDETNETIQKWSSRWQCAIACSPRTGLIVIDIDDEDRFQAWTTQHGINFPATAWDTTGGGGRHLLYDIRHLAEDDLPHQGGIPGGDIKFNGLVAVEPSVHPNGRPYVWQDRNVRRMPRSLARALRDYQNTPRSSTADKGSGSANLHDLREALLKAGNHDQHSALLDYVHALSREMSDQAIIALEFPRLLEGPDKLRSFSASDPWTMAGLKSALYSATERPTFASAAESALIDSLKAEPARTEQAASATSVFLSFHDIGTREKAEPAYAPREDGQYLIYPGKEHSIYGETECGKDMFTVAMVKDCLEREMSVLWVDFEEADNTDAGMRLLNLGLSMDLLCDDSLFRFCAPCSKKDTDKVIRLSAKLGFDVVVLNGVTAACETYGLMEKGWNEAATGFRSYIVSPFLRAGSAVISTDHVTKETNGTRSRYAFGGVMKLNMVTGSSYLIESKTPITRGGKGESRIFLTKDRPGSIKPHTAKEGSSPSVRLVGNLLVDSRGDGAGELSISITVPQRDRDEEGSSVAEDVRDRLEVLLLNIPEDRATKLQLKKIIPGTESVRAEKITEAVQMGTIEEIVETKGTRKFYYYTPSYDNTAESGAQ